MVPRSGSSATMTTSHSSGDISWMHRKPVPIDRGGVGFPLRFVGAGVLLAAGIGVLGVLGPGVGNTGRGLTPTALMLATGIASLLVFRYGLREYFGRRPRLFSPAEFRSGTTTLVAAGITLVLVSQLSLGAVPGLYLPSHGQAYAPVLDRPYCGPGSGPRNFTNPPDTQGLGFPPFSSVVVRWASPVGIYLVLWQSPPNSHAFDWIYNGTGNGSATFTGSGGLFYYTAYVVAVTPALAGVVPAWWCAPLVSVSWTYTTAL